MRKYLINGPEEYRVMNQTGVRQFVFPLDFTHNAIWDSAVSPDGKLFFALGSEIFNSNYARLCEYDYGTNQVTTHFAVEDVILPYDRAIRASKMHTSICFIDEDNLIMTTHTTDKSPLHPTWMPYQYHGHLWEGFQGSNLLTYNRRTRRAENLGVIMPHESTYGSCYDAAHRAMYSLGFFKGHLYRYSLDEKRVKDLGQASEAFSFRLVPGPDGNLYSCTRSGWLFKVDTDRQKIVDMNYRFPHYSATYPRQFTNISVGRVGPDGRLYFAVMYDSHIYALDTSTGRVECVGPHLPGGCRDFIRGENRCGIFGMDFDSAGNLWIAMTSKCDETPEPEQGYPSGLLRWDVQRDPEPEYVGLIGTPSRGGAWLSEVGVSKDDILFAVGSNHSLDGPDITAVDLKQYDPHRAELCAKPFTDGFYKTDDPRYLQSAGVLHRLEVIGEENPFQFEAEVIAPPVRLWRAYDSDAMEESGVAYLAWAPDGTLWARTAAETPMAAEIAGGELKSLRPLGEVDPAVRALLAPEAVRVPEGVKLPHVPGRQYKAGDYLALPISGGRLLAGTCDGLMAVVRGGDVFSLGMVAENGPVRAMTANADGTLVYGVAGDDEDLGTVFSYDDRRGLVRLGMVNTELPQYGDTAYMTRLTACALSPDGRTLAVGCAGRLGTVVLFAVDGR